MRLLELNWLDRLSLVVIGLGIITVFIPLSPSVVDGSVVNIYSLLTYIVELVQTNSSAALYIFLFVLFIFFSTLSIVLIIFGKRVFFKFTLFAATLSIVFFAVKDWPINTYISVMVAVYLFLFFFVVVADAIRNRIAIRREIRKAKDDNQDI